MAAASDAVITWAAARATWTSGSVTSRRAPSAPATRATAANAWSVASRPKWPPRTATRRPPRPRSRLPAHGAAGRVEHTGSDASGPAIAPKATARSGTRRVRGPTWSNDHASGATPARETRPNVGLSPNTPQRAAGTRIEPLVSVPSVSGTKPRGDRRSGAPRRASGDARRIVRVAGRTVMRVFRRESVRVLVHVQRAHEHGTRGAKTRDGGRVVRRRRPVGVDPRAGERGYARDVEEVLGGEWDAGQRAGIIATREPLVDRVGVGQSAIAQDAGERVENAVALRDARQGAGDDVTCSRLAGAHGGGDPQRRRRRVAHGWNRGAGSVASGSVTPSINRIASRSAARCWATAARRSGAMTRPICVATRSTSASVTCVGSALIRRRHITHRSDRRNRRRCSDDEHQRSRCSFAE